VAGCHSLREIEAILASQDRNLYHLGTERVCRSTLAVANGKRPAGLFQDLFALLVERLGERLPAGVAREGDCQNFRVRAMG
jgi:putative transposase